MPGAVPRTSTFALNNATFPFVLSLVNKGVKKALLDNPHLLNGLNIHEGQMTYEAIATELGYVFVPPRQALVGVA
jgi:alanine dehydrogenase